MNIQAKKLELVDLILKSDKPALLEFVGQVLKQEKDADWWDELPESVQDSIDTGLNQTKSGETIPHDFVVNELKVKYGLK